MDEQVKALAQRERSAYMKAWRAQNPTKPKEYNERYWLKRATAILQAQAQA